MNCTATRADGSACQAPALKGTGLCFWHNPAARAAMLEAAREGGSRVTIELPEAEELTVEKARRILSALIEVTALGSLDAETARSVGYLVGIDAKLAERQEI